MNPGSKTERSTMLCNDRPPGMHGSALDAVLERFKQPLPLELEVQLQQAVDRVPVSGGELEELVSARPANPSPSSDFAPGLPHVLDLS